jgi:hypothetical protein
MDAKKITPSMVRSAKLSLEANIKRREKKGEKVGIVEKPYHKGFGHIRCVLSIDGKKQRMFYLPETNLWRKA